MATTAHPDYSLILLSNRDEFLDRPTSKAKYWDEDSRILGPCDLLKKEHGTWIGVSTTGRLAVLLNYHEAEKPDGYKVSRGEFPKKFLKSDLAAEEWISREKQAHGESDLVNTGGFTMICGQATDPASLRLFSNRGGDKDARVFEQDTVCLSNSHYKQPWAKAKLGQTKLHELVLNHRDEPEEGLVKRLFELMKFDTFPTSAISIESVRHSIYIPPFTVAPGKQYGTRTSTIILVSSTNHVRYIERTLADNTTIEYNFDV